MRWLKRSVFAAHTIAYWLLPAHGTQARWQTGWAIMNHCAASMHLSWQSIRKDAWVCWWVCRNRCVMIATAAV